jgi:hypothetical protein
MHYPVILYSLRYMYRGYVYICVVSICPVLLLLVKQARARRILGPLYWT